MGTSGDAEKKASSGKCVERLAPLHNHTGKGIIHNIQKRGKTFIAFPRLVVV